MSTLLAFWRTVREGDERAHNLLKTKSFRWLSSGSTAPPAMPANIARSAWLRNYTPLCVKCPLSRRPLLPRLAAVFAVLQAQRSRLPSGSTSSEITGYLERRIGLAAGKPALHSPGLKPEPVVRKGAGAA